MKIGEVDFNKFVDDKLGENGFRIELLTKSLMYERLHDISSLVNDIKKHYSDAYGWKEENDEYFLKELPGKWKFSYVVIGVEEEICMVCINSIRNDEILHFHSVFVKKKYRNKGLSKLVLIKTAQAALENGIKKLDLYSQKNNLSAISLYNRAGFKIMANRNGDDILMEAEPENVTKLCYKLIENVK